MTNPGDLFKIPVQVTIAPWNLAIVTPVGSWSRAFTGAFTKVNKNAVMIGNVVVAVGQKKWYDREQYLRLCECPAIRCVLLEAVSVPPVGASIGRWGAR